MDIVIVISTELRGTLEKTGTPILKDWPRIAPCPLVVGDVIAYLEPTPFALQVKRRWFVPAHSTLEAAWHVELERVIHPTIAP